MKITPLAAESMGSRSMAVFVETLDCKILMDPGVSISPNRYGLAPHPFEKWCFQKQRERIQLFARLADILVITHYHSSHFMPDFKELYRDKVLLLKNPNQKIDIRQRNMAFTFLKRMRGIPKEIYYVDDKTLSFGNTQIVFSLPVFHGFSENRGFLIQATVHENDQTFLFSSDIQGSCRKEQLEYILSQNPLFLYLDGPVIQKSPVAEETLKKSLANIIKIIEKTTVTTIIIDHHMLRELHWKHRMEPVLAVANRHHVQIRTAAEFRGEEDQLLEARRKELYASDPPQNLENGQTGQS
ncbi:hypothetical protein MUP95_02625 [bacterium]|nr:hypothetical protein [bacterium]